MSRPTNKRDLLNLIAGWRAQARQIKAQIQEKQVELIRLTNDVDELEALVGRLPEAPKDVGEAIGQIKCGVSKQSEVVCCLPANHQGSCIA